MKASRHCGMHVLARAIALALKLLARGALEQFNYEGERRLAGHKRGCNGVRPHERAEDDEGTQLEVVAGCVFLQVWATA